MGPGADGLDNAVAELRAILSRVGLGQQAEALLARSLPSIRLSARTASSTRKSAAKLEVEAPVLPASLRVGVTDIVAGSAHCLALRADGSVVAWGRNGYGQLADGTRIDREDPVEVLGLPGPVAAVALGGMFDSLALTVTGAVMTWGVTSGPSPVPVPGLERGVTAIAGNLALLEDGSVLSWGKGANLGDGRPSSLSWADEAPRGIAAPVVGLPTSVIAISSRGHCLALLADGSVLAWGENDHGQLGKGQSGGRSRTPAPVLGLGRPVVAVVAAIEHSLALRDDGSVVAWGANRFGQLGDGTTDERTRPVVVSGIGGSVRAVASTWNHCFALRSDGALMAWGQNYCGQLGDGTVIDRPSPVPVIEERVRSGTVIGITAGDTGGFAFLADGPVCGWGQGVHVEKRDVPLGADADLRPGATKLGGRPDLPEGLAWPVSRGGPLTFVAQVDLAEVANRDSEGVLPPSGLLSFFFDAEHTAEGDTPAAAGVVLFTKTGASLSRIGFPVKLAPSLRCPSAPLQAEREVTLPAWADPAIEGAFPSTHESDAYWHLLLGRDQATAHRLLGHPNAVQSSHYQPIKCALASGSGSEARDWLLLAQFDSDPATQDWGDLGRLYYWIPKQDLAARRFDRVWVLDQSH